MTLTPTLAGKSAIVTGAGRGIGAATVRLLARAGAKVMLVDVAERAGQELAAELGAEGHTCSFYRADVSNEAAVSGYVRQAVDQFGKIDIFVNNAGIEGSVHPIADYPVEDFDRILAINLRGAFLGLKHVLKVMIAQKSGAVVNTSSVAGLRGSAGMCAYVCSKHAILGLTKTAVMEVAKHGVRVNAVCPGPIDTRMIHSLSEQSNPEKPDEGIGQMIARNPSGRIGTAEEVAAVILFLASDNCPFLNGEFVAIDGGRTAV